MACSKFLRELSEDNNLYLECAGCGDRFYYGRLNPEEMCAYYKNMKDESLWYCSDCGYDSDANKEDLKKRWDKLPAANYRQPRKNPKLEEAAQALKDREASMKTVDKRGGSFVDKNRVAERTEAEVEEEKNTEKEQTEAEEEKNAEKEAVQIEGEKEAVKEDEPNIQPENEDEFADMLALF